MNPVYIFAAVALLGLGALALAPDFKAAQLTLMDDVGVTEASACAAVASHGAAAVQRLEATGFPHATNAAVERYRLTRNGVIEASVELNWQAQTARCVPTSPLEPATVSFDMTTRGYNALVTELTSVIETGGLTNSKILNGGIVATNTAVTQPSGTANLAYKAALAKWVGGQILTGRRIVRASAFTVGLLFVVLLSGSAAAFSFGPLDNFAEVRSGKVTWNANVTIETNNLEVTATSITIGSTVMDFTPDGLLGINVDIVRWSNDYRTFRVTMDAGTRTGLNVSYRNPGYNLSVYEAGILTHTCANVVATCSWNFGNETNFNFSVLRPIAVEQLVSDPPPAQDSGGGGSGSPGPATFTTLDTAPASSTSQPQLPFDLPTPPAVFPRFGSMWWLSGIAGVVLTLNFFEPTRVILPKFAQFPGPRLLYLFAGIMILVLVYTQPETLL